MAGPRFNLEKNIIIFHKNYVKSENGCWNWTGYFDSKGYGRIKINYKQYGAHRVSWAIYHGFDPNYNFDGCVLHSCDNPACVNPNHLRLGTLQENSADMVFRSRSRGQRKTHCKRGHEFSEENTSFTKGKLVDRRVCKNARPLEAQNTKRRKWRNSSDHRRSNRRHPNRLAHLYHRHVDHRPRSRHAEPDRPYRLCVRRSADNC